ncbi:MAG: EAL domain-containing protein [Blastocatellia bacterium]|nr:EAL domain-containing protein [Blastocatellia bacterium]
MQFIDMSDYNRGARAYWWTVLILGALALVYGVVGVLRLERVEFIGAVALMAVGFLVGLRPICIPGTKTSITPGDIFMFLAMLFWGVPTALLIAVTDAFAASYRSSRRWTSRLGSPAMMAIAIFISGGLFEWGLSWLNHFQIYNSGMLFMALLLFSLIHFVLNSALITTQFALKKRTPLFALWWENYAWAGLTYMASASAAGLIYLAIKQYGIGSLLAAVPLVAIIFATSYLYFKRADERTRSAEEQARQSELHLQELGESEERFRSAFNHAAIGMALVAPDGKWLQVNTALCQIVGYTEDELLAADFQSITHPEDLGLAGGAIAQLCANRVPVTQIEKRYLHKLGHTVWVLLTASSISNKDGHPSRLIFQIQDITDRRRAEEQLVHNAFHDALTGLPNRALFMDHLKLALARRQRHTDQIFAVLFLDFDRFKIINDSLGHMAGDQLLVRIARRLEKCSRPGDTVARLGGDEFTILLEDLGSPDEAVAAACRIQKDLKSPYRLGDQEVFITASVGIAPSNAGYQKPEDILRDADTAMYTAKSLGKARYALFEQSMHARALTLLQLETDLRHAIERREFFVVYQPIVSLVSGRLSGFEALVRWQHPARGLIGPADFIPIAEETGHIIAIGQWVLEEACRQMRRWQVIGKDEGFGEKDEKKQGSRGAAGEGSSFAHAGERGSRGAGEPESLHPCTPAPLHLCIPHPSKKPFAVSVNLSIKQFAQPNLIESILQTLERTGLDPHQLKLEITESAVMEDFDAATAMLEQLRARGVGLSIDDFGTGYSSLSYLHRLPVDTLKIDRSFIARMATSNENAEIVRAIIVLAKNLGMEVIAEGVETPEQLEWLRRLECDNGQGYLFARPLELEAANQLVRQMDEWRAFIPSLHSHQPSAISHQPSV